MIDRPRGDDGAALVLALGFLSLFGVLVAAVLSFADANLRGTPALRDRMAVGYAAEAAVESAIQRIRPDTAAGVAGSDSTCFTLAGGTLSSSDDVAVRCVGELGSGARTGGNPLNRPAQTVLTLSDHANEGVVQTSNATVTLRGDVISRTRVANTAASAETNVLGAVVSPVCTGAVTATDNRCGTAPGALAADPAYALAATTAPPYATPPACTAVPVLTLSPGSYRSAAALTALTSGGACSGAVLWLRPGFYYFDFDDAGSHEWRLDDSALSLVGGTPAGWNPAAGVRPDLPLPGACDRSGAGVQLAFGGDSRMRVANGNVELCAQPSATSQQIAVYGVRADAPAPDPVTATPTAAVAPTGAWTSPGSATAVDGAFATAAVADGATAGLTLTGYTTTLPAGAVVTGATLAVTHRTSSMSAGDTRVTLRAGDGSASAYDVAGCTSTCTRTVDVLAALSTPTRAATASVDYTATAARNKSLSAHLDGVTLTVTYTVPRFRATSGCAAATPYSPGSSTTCPLLSGVGNRSRIAVHGTVYAPRAALDLAMTNSATQVVTRGVVVRHLHLSLTPSADYSGPFISVPDDGVSADRVVLLTASVRGEPRLRVRVRIDDAGGTTPGRAVEVQSWSVLR